MEADARPASANALKDNLTSGNALLSAECRLRTADQKVSRGYGLAFAALIVSVAAVFWQHLFTSDVLFFRDITGAHFPRVVEMRALVRAGLLPLWNPFEHFGESVVVNPNYLLFYPTTWLTWVLPAAYGFKLHFVLHFFLAAAGAFLLARRVGLKPFPCYVAGALFVFSGPVMSLGNFYNVLPATAWMPLAVLAADYQMRRGGWRGAGLVATCLALQVFAGSPLTSLVTIALVLGWAIAFYGDFAAPFWAGANRRLFGRFLWGLMLAGGLAAVQVVPTLWHLRHTQRAGHFTYQHGLIWSLHPLKFVEMLSPHFWGDPFFDAGLPWLYLEGRALYLFPSVFIGIVPLALAVVAILVRTATGGEATTDGTRATRLWLVVGVVALALALGRFTPLGLVFYDLFPLFRFVRFPVKFLVPATLAATQLAALGVQYLLNGRTEGAHARWLRRLSVGLLALGLVWLILAAIPVFWPGPARAVAGWLTALEFDHSRALNVRQTLGIDRTELLARATDWLMWVIPARLPGVLGAALLMAGILSGRLRESLRRRLVVVVTTAGILLLASVHYTLNPLADRRLFEDTPPAMRYLEPTHPSPGVPAVQPPAARPCRVSLYASWRDAGGPGGSGFLAPSSARPLHLPLKPGSWHRPAGCGEHVHERPRAHLAAATTVPYPPGVLARTIRRATGAVAAPRQRGLCVAEGPPVSGGFGVDWLGPERDDPARPGLSGSRCAAARVLGSQRRLACSGAADDRPSAFARI